MSAFSFLSCVWQNIKTYLLASLDDENVATTSVWKGPGEGRCLWGWPVWLLNGISSLQVPGKTLFCIISPLFDAFTRLCKAVWSHHSPCFPHPFTPPSPTTLPPPSTPSLHPPPPGACRHVSHAADENWANTTSKNYRAALTLTNAAWREKKKQKKTSGVADWGRGRRVALSTFAAPRRFK